MSITTSDAQHLAATLNHDRGGNWAQDYTYDIVDEGATRAAGYDPDRMGDPGQSTVCTDGSRVRFDGAKGWVAS